MRTLKIFTKLSATEAEATPAPMPPQSSITQASYILQF